MAVSAFYSFKSVRAGQHVSKRFSSTLTFCCFGLFKRYYIILIHNTSRIKGALRRKAARRPGQQLHHPVRATLMMHRCCSGPLHGREFSCAHHLQLLVMTLQQMRWIWRLLWTVCTSLWHKCHKRRCWDRGSERRTPISRPAMPRMKSMYLSSMFCASECCWQPNGIHS